MFAYVVSSAVPLLLLITIIAGIASRKEVLALFIEGVNEGLRVALKIFSNILAITIAVSLLKDTGALTAILAPTRPVLLKLGVPEDIIPVAFLKPLSGGATFSMVIDIFKEFGADSREGEMASVIMAGSETTIYVTTMLLSVGKIKRKRGVLIAGLMADIIAIGIAVWYINYF